MTMTKAKIMEGVLCQPVSSKIIARNTVEYKAKSGDRVVRYYNTDIIREMPLLTMFDTDGYRTMWTKRRLNELQDERCATIYQEDGLWYMLTRKWKKVPFFDGIMVNRSTRDIIVTNSTARRRISIKIKGSLKKWALDYHLGQKDCLYAIGSSGLAFGSMAIHVIEAPVWRRMLQTVLRDESPGTVVKKQILNIDKMLQPIAEAVEREAR